MHDLALLLGSRIKLQSRRSNCVAASIDAYLHRLTFVQKMLSSRLITPMLITRMQLLDHLRIIFKMNGWVGQTTACNVTNGFLPCYDWGTKSLQMSCRHEMRDILIRSTRLPLHMHFVLQKLCLQIISLSRSSPRAPFFAIAIAVLERDYAVENESAWSSLRSCRRDILPVRRKHLQGLLQGWQK